MNRVERRLLKVMDALAALEREERLLEGELGRIRDVEVGPDGLLYILTDESDGALYRLQPAQDPA